MAIKIDEQRARRILGEWRRSGVSASAYAKVAGVSKATLFRWRERFEGSKSEGPAFARVVVRGARELATRNEGADEFIVESLGGRRIHVRVGFDGEEFGRLLEIVESGEC